MNLVRKFSSELEAMYMYMYDDSAV